jgi:hypothetical protein
MALRDLIHKRGAAKFASAIPAIPATEYQSARTRLAEIAGLALARDTKPIGSSSVHQTYSEPLAMLQLFRFDLVEEEIRAGHSGNELQRINNMAWEFMKTDKIPFSVAIKAAAEIVINCEMISCESAYEDVQALFERIRSGI